MANSGNPVAAPEEETLPPKSFPKPVWDTILDRIAEPDCACTPFIGAGAAAGLLPSGRKLAEAWAEEIEFPFTQTTDLALVSQYLAVTTDAMRPKERLIQEFKKVKLPDFAAPGEPHGQLAALPFTVYITTNYDHFMFEALKAAGRTPRQEFCRWNSELKSYPSVFDADQNFKPTVESPLVYHLHGHIDEPHSLVLTEDDYLDFIVNTDFAPDIIPPRIIESLGGTTLLFVGYRAADWNFKVLFRSLVRRKDPSQAQSHFAVQLHPREIAQENAKEYYERYFGQNKISIYWGRAEEFTSELRRRWEARPK